MELTLRDLIGGGGIVGLLLGCWVLYARIDAHRRRKRDHSFSRVLPKIHEVYSILNAIKQEVPAHRVAILVSENGGGRPHIGGQVYTSVVYETFESPLSALRPRWQRQPLDEQYIELLSKIVTNGEAIFLAAAHEEPGILRDMNESQGISGSRYYLIAERETELLYMSIAFVDDKQIDTPATRDALRGHVSELRALFAREARL